MVNKKFQITEYLEGVLKTRDIQWYNGKNYFRKNLILKLEEGNL